MRPALQPPPDALGDLRRRLDALAGELDDLRLRLDALTTPHLVAAPAPVPVAAAASGDREVLPLLGRAFVVLGGAFLVRALTDGGALSPRVGVALGFAYALGCLAWSVRAARHGRRAQALADGVAAALIVHPLLWEAVHRFGVLERVGAAAALALASHALLAAAVLCALPPLAWVAALGGVATALVLFLATHALAPLGVALLLLAFSTRALARNRGWAGLGWPALAGAAVLVGAGVLLVTGERGVPASFGALGPVQVVALALGLPLAVVLASAVPRRDRAQMPLSGVVQVGAAVAVGYAAALRVAEASGWGRAPLALGGLAAAAIALAWGERQRDRQPLHADASTLVALAVALYASVQVLPFTPRLIAWTVAGAAVCASLRSPALGWMGAALVALAALASVLAGALVPGAVVAAAALFARARLRAVERAARLRDALAVAALCAMALLALTAAARLAAGDAAVRATATTFVLAAAALVLAALARRGRAFGPPVLVHVALLAGGLKLLAFDLRQGRPATLFVGFVLYGAALILAPRLLRRPG